MSDEEDVRYVKRQKTIHYGTLEQEMARQMRESAENKNGSSTASTTSAVKMTTNVPEYFDIDAEV